MIDINDRAITMARDLVEETTARKMCVEVLRASKEIPVEDRIRFADSKLHQALLQEMLAYKDRLVKQCERLLKEARMKKAKGKA